MKFLKKKTHNCIINVTIYHKRPSVTKVGSSFIELQNKKISYMWIHCLKQMELIHYLCKQIKLNNFPAKRTGKNKDSHNKTVSINIGFQISIYYFGLSSNILKFPTCWTYKNHLIWTNKFETQLKWLEIKIKYITDLEFIEYFGIQLIIHLKYIQIFSQIFKQWKNKQDIYIEW